MCSGFNVNIKVTDMKNDGDKQEVVTEYRYMKQKGGCLFLQLIEFQSNITGMFV